MAFFLKDPTEAAVYSGSAFLRIVEPFYFSGGSQAGGGLDSRNSIGVRGHLVRLACWLDGGGLMVYLDFTKAFQTLYGFRDWLLL